MTHKLKFLSIAFKSDMHKRLREKTQFSSFCEEILTVFGYLNVEGEPISDSHSTGFSTVPTQDYNLWQRGLGSARYLQSSWVPNEKIDIVSNFVNILDCEAKK